MILHEIHCSRCESPMKKAIYTGLPLRICGNEECCFASGIGAWLIGRIPLSKNERENGGWCLMHYEGSYLAALYRWLFFNEEV